LAAAGQSWWQVLPLGPPDRYHSPYKAKSAFAVWRGVVAGPPARGRAACRSAVSSVRSCVASRRIAAVAAWQAALFATDAAGFFWAGFNVGFDPVEKGPDHRHRRNLSAANPLRKLAD